ncbi:dihydroneopterin aldolase [Candidatus Synechococcus calcipolaris G9]|uniref:7,8-dihydroneopterin aldolase n=1 Tax=Candidatus Synechococcus calcipolaris G9 TaxID=1497997 RepID=A0ABT6EUI9_9SYNE|nr:dihydroneopterin aldolase [Candidatus Synechococcus calcipolaris]MDG2989531.1 dihydroneopterin aldolase [Candidatus Synechococcus calcipolaris G9]
MDSLHLSGLRCYGYTGALPEEQTLGQWFEIDIVLGLDLTLPAQTDCLEDTLDYRPLLSQVKDLVQTARFSLIERLTDAVVQLCLDLDQVQRVKVRVTKIAPPVPDFGGQITIEMERSRP